MAISFDSKIKFELAQNQLKVPVIFLLKILRKELKKESGYLALTNPDSFS